MERSLEERVMYQCASYGEAIDRLDAALALVDMQNVRLNPAEHGHGLKYASISAKLCRGMLQRAAGAPLPATICCPKLGVPAGTPMHPPQQLPFPAHTGKPDSTVCNGASNANPSTGVDILFKCDFFSQPQHHNHNLVNGPTVVLPAPHVTEWVQLAQWQPLCHFCQ